MNIEEIKYEYEKKSNELLESILRIAFDGKIERAMVLYDNYKILKRNFESEIKKRKEIEEILEGFFR